MREATRFSRVAAVLRRAFVGRRILIVLLIVAVTSSGTVFADPAYKDAIAHTERVQQAYIDAWNQLQNALNFLYLAELAYRAAQIAYNQANNNPMTTAVTLAAMQFWAAVVVALNAIIDALVIALAAAAAAAAGFLAGTGIYQLGYAFSDWCWDPLCDARFSAAGAFYVAPTDAEVEAVLPEMLERMTGVSRTKAEYGGSAAPAWSFMRDAVKLYIVLGRGAAAATANQYHGVIAAANDGNALLRSIPGSMLSAADLIENTDVIPASVTLGDGTSGSVLDGLNQGVTAADQILAAAAQPPAGNDPCRPANGGPGCDNSAVVSAVNDLKSALVSMIQEIQSRPLVGAGGAPRKLIDFFRVGTRAEFLSFVQACQTNGAAAVPAGEIQAADRLLEVAGVRFPSMPSFGTALAFIDAHPDGAEEAALFNGTGTNAATHARVLRISGSTLSNSGYWLNMNLEQSPLTIQARSFVPAGVPVSSKAPALGGLAALLFALGLMSVGLYWLRLRSI